MNKPWPDINVIHTVVFDFDGVFTDNRVYVNQQGIETVCCNRSDGLAFDLVRCYRAKYGLSAEFFILSKEENSVVKARADKLRLTCHHGVSDKLTFMQNYLQQRHADKKTPFEGVIYLGNDLNDLAIMLRVGFSVAPSDAHYKIKEIASVVLGRKGGDEFVREFVEKLLGIDRMPIHELAALLVMQT